MSLHWSRDEMGSRDGLETRLGRERLKDTSLDYARVGQTDRDREIQSESQGPVASYPYAARRGLVPESEIVLREHQVRPAQERGPAQAPAGDAAPEQLIASGRAGFRDRYEAHKRQQAVETARDEQARDLVRQWAHLTEAYNKALPGLEADPTLGGTRAGLLRFGDALQVHSDAAQALRERGPAFGIANDSPLARVLADRQPSRAITDLMNGVEKIMRDHLKHQAAERLERRLSRGHGMSR
jgi:hypothetical protein